MRDFETKTYGKWILAGEHAVLRGCPALAFPLLTRSLELQYRSSQEPLSVDFAGPHGPEINLLFYGVLENAMTRLRVSEAPRGRFRVTNHLPIGAGLGASAALCGAISRWCEAQGWIMLDEVYEFARKLEDLFHGESSGVDLAVSLSAQGVRFVRGGERSVFKPAWWPNLYLSYSGQRGMTSDCVAKVKRLFETEAARAQALDQRMREAVELAEKSLSHSEPEAREQLRDSFELANSCFVDWGLSFGELERHIAELREAGAAAVKPTGSGGGGYVLSLWDGEPSEKLRNQLVAVPEPHL
jgi:mevalonate kinase